MLLLSNDVRIRAFRARELDNGPKGKLLEFEAHFGGERTTRAPSRTTDVSWSPPESCDRSHPTLEAPIGKTWLWNSWIGVFSRTVGFGPSAIDGELALLHLFAIDPNLGESPKIREFRGTTRQTLRNRQNKGHPQPLSMILM